MVSPFQVSQLNPTTPELTNQFGIYVHVPFCIHKCSYCDFYSFTKYGPGDFQRFVESWVREARSAAQWLREHRPLQSPVTSIFLGGGTPSLLPMEFLQTLFSVLQGEFDWAPEIEITLEANPETVTEELAFNWREKTPLNRISMGAQSFQPKYLEALERLGSPSKIQESAGILKRVGLHNFNLDLIIGIPQQTPDEIELDIDWAIRLEPKHLSNYNLSLKPGHPLFKKLPSNDVSADIYEAARKKITNSGFGQYEISNYAVPGFECAHNLLYWSGADYLGLGPSAASRFFWDGVFWHRKQMSDYSAYLAQHKFEERLFEQTTQEQTQLEALFLELRQNKGINLRRFLDRYGLDVLKSPKIELFEKAGWLKVKEPTLSLTDQGRLLTDSIVCELC